MGRDPTKQNQNLYCQYHQDRGHTTKDCRTLCDFLGQLVKFGKLNQFTHSSSSQGEASSQGYQREIAPRLPLGTIHVIFANPNRQTASSTLVLTISQHSKKEEEENAFKRAKMKPDQVLGFSKQDKLGTTQPHHDTLVVTLRIGGFYVKRIMVDQGSGVEIMYLNLY